MHGAVAGGQEQCQRNDKKTQDDSSHIHTPYRLLEEIYLPTKRVKFITE